MHPSDSDYCHPGTYWMCCTCRAKNPPTTAECIVCHKLRWSQLDLPPTAIRDLHLATQAMIVPRSDRTRLATAQPHPARKDGKLTQ